MNYIFNFNLQFYDENNYYWNYWKFSKKKLYSFKSLEIIVGFS